MKDYNELIKKLEETYNRKLEIKVEETEKNIYIYIYGLLLINSITLEKFKDYCDDYYISTNKDFLISIGLIINKN